MGDVCEGAGAVLGLAKGVRSLGTWPVIVSDPEARLRRFLWLMFCATGICRLFRVSRECVSRWKRGGVGGCWGGVRGAGAAATAVAAAGCVAAALGD